MDIHNWIMDIHKFIVDISNGTVLWISIYIIESCYNWIRDIGLSPTE